MKRLLNRRLLIKPGSLSLLAAIATSHTKFAAFLAVTLLAANISVMAQRIDGLWDASIAVNGVAVPFRVEISTKGTDASSYFFNGDEKVNPSTSGSFRDGNLLLEFASYATQLTATLKDGALTGAYVISSENSYPVHAEPHHSSSQAVAAPARSIPASPAAQAANWNRSSKLKSQIALSICLLRIPRRAQTRTNTDGLRRR